MPSFDPYAYGSYRAAEQAGGACKEGLQRKSYVFQQNDRGEKPLFRVFPVGRRAIGDRPYFVV